MEVNPKAYPLADPVLSKKIVNLITQAQPLKQVRTGANESSKMLKRGKAELLILAADVAPIEIVLHLPLLCEDKNVPYVFISSKECMFLIPVLGRSCGIGRPTVACSIIAREGSRLSSSLKTIRDDIEKLLV